MSDLLLVHLSHTQAPISILSTLHDFEAGFGLQGGRIACGPQLMFVFVEILALVQKRSAEEKTAVAERKYEMAGGDM